MTNDAHEPDTASLRPNGPFSDADLPIDANGRIYHLQLKPEQIAPDILLVGDPGRAEFIGSYLLREVEVAREHRGLITVTGTAEITGGRTTVISPLRTTVATSGMGTPSLEIVLNELVALHEIDFATRTRRKDFPPLTVIRVGHVRRSAGGHAAGHVHRHLLRRRHGQHGYFFTRRPAPTRPASGVERELESAVRAAMPPASRFHGRIRPYVSRSDPAVAQAMMQASADLGLRARLGLTVSNSGFFAPQGRDVSRLAPSVPELDRVLADFDPSLGGQRIENMEMEASFLCHLLGGLGHRAGVICPAVANRRSETFDHDYLDAVEQATRAALLAMTEIRRQDRKHG